MKKNNSHKKMVSALCEYGIFTDELNDCNWCDKYCYKDTKELKLNDKQQHMEKLFNEVETAGEKFRKEAREALKK